MSGEPKAEDGTILKRVPVVVRSWDGPNSRVGLEMDLAEMPWGPFDALGKRLSLLLPASDEANPVLPSAESQVERALRHVEHAANRCAEFAQLANGSQDVWLRSQETWEWIRRYLTSLWVDVAVDGENPPDLSPEVVMAEPSPEPTPSAERRPFVPPLPGAASTLKVAARALRATPLSAWREAVGSQDPEAPTREEAVQTLLGVARILGGQAAEVLVDPVAPPETVPETPASSVSAPVHNSAPPPDPDQVSFDFARGYDEGYQMGRRVGRALGSHGGSSSGPPHR
jgi:hypothetical protein